jgi:hypothetical protein
MMIARKSLHQIAVVDGAVVYFSSWEMLMLEVSCH